MSGELKLTINNHAYTVEVGSVPASFSLNDYIREKALLKGTKSMCKEGGCGICTVTVQRPTHGKEEPVNSCLVPIHACNGWHVTTIEGLGNTETGYNKIQENLADYNGSQCGFCSPGMVMTMYGAARQLGEGVKEKLESCFDGNICRCTGYRPIMNAMQQCADIEDLTLCKNCPQREESSAPDASFCQIQSSDGSVWYQPKSIDQLKSLLAKHAKEKYYIIAGHTGEAVYKRDGPHSIYINISDVLDMCAVSEEDGGVRFGAGINLTTMMQEFERRSTSVTGLMYLGEAAKYIDCVANLQVRNMGTWAGNLMMKYHHKDFPSDIFILLESVGATLTILDCVKGTEINGVRVADMLDTDMSGCVILSVTFYNRPGWTLWSCKVMPVYRNSHTKLSIALFIRLQPDMVVMERPSLVYAGVGRDYVHAVDVEESLVGRKLNDDDTIQGCVSLLKNIKFEEAPGHPSATYRRSLAQSLFYKAVLAVAGSACKAELRSGGEVLVRADRSTGQQDFQTDPTQYPLTQPLPKLDSRKQTAGEAQFIGDLPEMTGQLHAVYVKSTQASADIKSVDTSQALLAPGVVRVLTYKDIPGQNIVIGPEILLAETSVSWYGQPLAILVAETEAQALSARELVKVEYENMKKPILTIEEAIQAKSFHDVPNDMGLPTAAVKGNVDEALKSCDVVVEGSVETGEQYGMHTETQRCTVLPEEGFYTVYSSTQVMQAVLNNVANVLGISANKVEVRVRRIGGGFGAKQSRSVIVSGGAALAAHSTGRPVTMCLTLEDNMELLGRRMPCRLDYKVGVNRDMKLQCISGTVYENCGYNINEATILYMSRWLDNAYFIPNWNVKPVSCKTNQPNHSAIRAPSMLAAMHLNEQMIQRIAAKLGVSDAAFREANFYKEGESNAFNDVLSPCLIQETWDQLRTSADYDKRAADIEQFNKDNVWRKKGISLVPLRYGYSYWPGTAYTVCVGINYEDASVVITHGGVEIGQGINTKVIQTAAHSLGIPMDMISVQPTSTTHNINCGPTGGSVTSDMNCLGIRKACATLLKAMEPHKKEGMTWKEVVNKCKNAFVDLQSRHFLTFLEAGTFPSTGGFWQHNVFGTGCAEVELDILTGNYIIHRLDILYDCGASYNPDIDIGQIEGALVMGLGHFLMEEYKYDPETGRCLTNNTWEYKVPYSRDIPEDFRVTLLKDKRNESFALGSKVVGEPPLILAETAVVALQNAVKAFKTQQGSENTHAVGDAPFTIEKITLACQVDTSKFTV